MRHNRREDQMARTNAERAEKAYRAILNYEDDSSPEECISDLLGDLRHLCDESGYDFAERDDVGRRNYETELGEEAESRHEQEAETLEDEDDRRVRPDGPETDRGGLIGQGGY